MLRRSPAFALSAVLVFTLCLAASIIALGLAHALLIQPFPGFRNLESLVAIWSTRADTDRYAFTLAEYLDYRNQSRTLDRVAAFGKSTGSLRTDHGSERLVGLRISTNFFAMAGTPAMLGRTLEPRDETVDAPRAILLSHSLWARAFGSRPEMVGKNIVMNGQDHLVVGVLPKGFQFPNSNPEFMVPLKADCDPLRNSHVSTNFLRLFGRIRAGTTIEQVRNDLSGIASRLRTAFPESNSDKLGVRIVPLRDQILGKSRANVLIVLGAVFLFLMVATLNMAGVFVVHALRYGHDLAVLTALGTGPLGLFGHVLAQSSAVCVAAGALGAALAQWCLPQVGAFIPDHVPHPEYMGLTPPVLFAGFLLSLICGIIFGMPAALHARKLPGSGVLRMPNRLTCAVRDDGARRLLVMTEVAFCLVVVIGTGLLLRSFLRLESVNPGFRASNLLTFRLVMPPSRFPAREEAIEAHDRLLAALVDIPGVEAGEASNLPLNGVSGMVDVSVLDGRPKSAKVLDAPYVVADESYFRTMGIPILMGRALGKSDTGSTLPVIVISKNLADQFRHPNCPIGTRLQIDDNAGRPREVTVVGVADDVSDKDLETRPAGTIYVPLRQVPQSFAHFFVNNMSWVVRTPGPPMDFSSLIRDRVVSAAKDGGLSKMQPMETYVDMALDARRFHLRSIGIFALGVLILAALGLYALMSQSVHQRTREIGVRVALGARSGQILLDVIGEGLTLTFAGIGIGLGAIFVLARILSTMLFEVPVYDPLTIVGSMLLMIVVSVLATSLPAQRATRLDPILALRQK